MRNVETPKLSNHLENEGIYDDSPLIRKMLESQVGEKAVYTALEEAENIECFASDQNIFDRCDAFEILKQFV